MVVLIKTEDIPKEIKPLIKQVQVIVEKTIPDSIDNTYIQSTIDVRCDYPTFHDKKCTFPDVVICISFRLKRYKPDIWGELQEERTEHIAVSHHIDTTLWNWEQQKYVSDVAEEYYTHKLNSTLTECILHIVSFAKGNDIKSKEKAV